MLRETVLDRQDNSRRSLSIRKLFVARFEDLVGVSFILDLPGTSSAYWSLVPRLLSTEAGPFCWNTGVQMKDEALTVGEDGLLTLG